MMRRILFESLVIFLFSVSLALLTNQFRSDGLPLLRPKPLPIPIVSDNNQNEGTLPFPAFRERLHQVGVLILDARSPDEFLEGHIPGAKNLPYYEVSEKAALVLKEVPFDQEIITYCEGIECSNAEDLAFFLKEKGYKHVKVFEGGWEEWVENKMPVEKEKSA